MSGRIAWVLRLRPCLAEPPAESPSTMKSSHSAGSFSWQSASLPGRPAMSSAPLRRVRSRALRAASRARAASTILPAMIARVAAAAPAGTPRASRPTISSTTGRTSEETSFSLVCDENLGSGTFTDSTRSCLRACRRRTARPSPAWRCSFCRCSCSSVRVSAARKPVRWVPPSRCGMLLVKQNIVLLVGVVPLHRDVDGDAVLLAAGVEDVRVQRRLRCGSGARRSPCMPPSYANVLLLARCARRSARCARRS